MGATIKDVAREANVSVSTVSRVLRDEGYFSEEARKKVLKAAKKLNYRVNAIGKSLRSRRTKVIGHISLGGSLNPFPAEIMKRIDQKAYEQGYHVIVSNTGGNANLEEEQINTLLERRVDGIIITTPTSKKNIEYLKESGHPFVMVENTVDIDGVNKVVIDNKKAVFKAVNYLYEQGHDRILFIGSNPDDGVSKDRLSGYINAYEENELDLKKDYILLGEDYTFEVGKELANKFIENNTVDVTAIIVSGDTMILGVMQSLYEKGIKIPEDISMIGLNDLLTPYLSPALTSIAQPVNDMGKEAVELLLRNIENPGMSPITITLDTKMSIRNTVKRLY